MIDPERLQEIMSHQPRFHWNPDRGNIKRIVLTLPASYIDALHACAESINISLTACIRRGVEEFFVQRDCDPQALARLLERGRRIQDRSYGKNGKGGKAIKTVEEAEAER